MFLSKVDVLVISETHSFSCRSGHLSSTQPRSHNPDWKLNRTTLHMLLWGFSAKA